MPCNICLNFRSENNNIISWRIGAQKNHQSRRKTMKVMEFKRDDWNSISSLTKWMEDNKRKTAISKTFYKFLVPSRYLCRVFTFCSHLPIIIFNIVFGCVVSIIQVPSICISSTNYWRGVVATTKKPIHMWEVFNKITCWYVSIVVYNMLGLARTTTMRGMPVISQQSGMWFGYL